MWYSDEAIIKCYVLTKRNERSGNNVNRFSINTIRRSFSNWRLKLANMLLNSSIISPFMVRYNQNRSSNHTFLAFKLQLYTNSLDSNIFSLSVNYLDRAYCYFQNDTTGSPATINHRIYNYLQYFFILHMLSPS
jgi:hypothetical protein